MNTNTFKKINKQINNAVDGNVVIESTIFEENTAVPPVKIQRHFTPLTNRSITSTYACQRRSIDDSNNRVCLVNVPKLIDDTAIDEESNATKRSQSNKTSRYNVSKSYLRKSKLKNNDNTEKQSNDGRKPVKSHVPAQVKGSNASQLLKSKDLKRSDIEPVSTTNLRLNLDNISNQLSLFEESLPVSKLGGAKSLRKNTGSTLITKDNIKGQKNLKVSLIDTDKRPYDADMYSETCENQGTINIEKFKTEQGIDFSKVDADLFVSEFGKNVADIYSRSNDESFVMSIDNKSTCQYAENEKLKKIRDELKKWKQKYLAKTGHHFDDPSETSCEICYLEKIRNVCQIFRA